MIEAIVAIICIFGIPLSIPLLNIWTKHQREMMQLRIQMQGQGGSLSNTDVETLRQEIRALRETSMQYDLSFDAALQRLEQRVVRVEQNAQNTSFRSATTPEEAAMTLRTGN